MTRYERRQFFDRLVQLRALYRLRGTDDSTVAMSIEAVIDHAAHLYEDVDALAAAVGPDPAQRPGAPGPKSRQS